jgi:hypothetical protein
MCNVLKMCISKQQLVFSEIVVNSFKDFEFKIILEDLFFETTFAPLWNVFKVFLRVSFPICNRLTCLDDLMAEVIFSK